MKDYNLENEAKTATEFKIPEGYFDSFSEKIMTQISSKSLKKDTKVFSLFDRNRKWILSIAASFVVLFSASYYIYNSNKEQSEITEIEHYIVTNSTITDDDIAGLLNENDIQKLSVD